MPSRPGARHPKTERPPADATCALARTVRRGGLCLELWTCTSPRLGEPLDRPRRLRLVPATRIRRRRRKHFFWLSCAGAARDDAPATEAGWCFEDAHDLARVRDPYGPFDSLDEAIAIARLLADRG